LGIEGDIWLRVPIGTDGKVIADQIIVVKNTIGESGCVAAAFSLSLYNAGALIEFYYFLPPDKQELERQELADNLKFIVQYKINLTSN